VHFCVRGCHPVSRAFPDASTNTHTDSGSGLLLSSGERTGKSPNHYLYDNGVVGQSHGKTNIREPAGKRAKEGNSPVSEIFVIQTVS